MNKHGERIFYSWRDLRKFKKKWTREYRIGNYVLSEVTRVYSLSVGMHINQLARRVVDIAFATKLCHNVRRTL